MVGDVCTPWCNEAYTTVQLPASASRKGTASLHVKVDTRAGGNVLPIHVFQHLYLNQISPAHLPTGLDHVSTWLTTYDGSHIPLYGALHGPITWQPGCPGAPPHWVHLYWYVADTPSPAILGLPSCKRLAVVKMNCAITVMWPGTKPPSPAPVPTTVRAAQPATVPAAAKSIRTTDDLIMEFPDQFTGIGRFLGKYKIWLQHDVHPVIHAPGNAPSPCTWKSRNTSTRWNAWEWSPHRLGILHYLHSEGKWWAMPVLGSPWPQWGHLLRSSPDTHCGGSCSWVCTLSLLHQVGCPPGILVNHPWPGVQPA